VTATSAPPAVAGRTAVVRRVLLGVAVVAAPALQVAGMLLHPPLAAEHADQLAIVAEDPGRWFVAHVVAASAAALFLVAAPALAGLARARGAAPATAGAVLTVLGGATLAIAFGAEAHLLSVAADPSLDAAAMTALAALEGHSPAMTMILLGVPLTGIGQILLAAGLLRARVVPRWAPALVLVGLLASIAGTPGSLIGPVLLLPAVVGYAALAVAVARA
jgi:hypothetical protein